MEALPTNLTDLASRVPDEAAAYRMLETLCWGQDRQVCPHCASIGGHYFLTPRNGVSRQTRTGTETQRRLWKCADCRKQFSALTGTVMHRTKIPVRKWLFVLFEMCTSKNGVAAREIERKYSLTPKAAWFMVHRIREAMKRGPLASALSGIVIADETHFGGQPKNRHGGPRHGKQGHSDKQPILSLIETRTGEVRSRVVANVSGATLASVIHREVDLPNAVLHTDQAQQYVKIGRQAAGHETVDHTRGEYVRDGVTTNALEGFFSQLKRSLDGTHHHVSVEHLPRYLAEFDFRYSNREMTDSQRMTRLLGQAGGRRLTYRPTSSESDSSSLVA